MKIAFDAQLLFENQKTGIGWNAKMLIDQLILSPDLECILNCFLMRDKRKVDVVLENYRKKGCIIRQSKWMPGRIYNHLERIFPFPYQWIFGKDAEVTQFFNYTIPFGAAGKKVTIVHDMAFMACPETVEKRTYRWLKNNLRKYCKRANVILTVSEFSRQEIHRYLGVPLEKIEVIHNGVDLEHYHPDYSSRQIEEIKARHGIPGKYILYLGTLEPRKNLNTLVTAYHLFKNSVAEESSSFASCQIPKLVLAGKKGWMYDSIFSLIQQYGLENDVIFTGYVGDADVPPLFCGASIFIYPSLYEGFGIPPIEAMACGTPVIVADTSSLPEVVGEAGIMFPPMDANLLKEKMIMLLSDSELRERYILAGLEQAKRFSWKNSADKLIQIYKKLENAEAN